MRTAANVFANSAACASPAWKITAGATTAMSAETVRPSVSARKAVQSVPMSAPHVPRAVASVGMRSAKNADAASTVRTATAGAANGPTNAL